jgi:hypothetical protein
VFDFDNFDWDRRAPAEKVSWWAVPVYLLIFVLAQILFIAPFLIAALLCGKRYALLGWVGVGFLFLLGFLLLRAFQKFIPKN